MHKKNQAIFCKRADLSPPLAAYDENVGRITIKIDNDKLNPSPENGGVLGYVVDSYDQKELTGATVTAIDEKGKEYTVLTDSEGHFELVLPEGVYTLKAKKADYIEMVLPGTYTVKAEEVITLKENIMLESVENAFINTVIDNESVWKDSSSEMWFQDLNFDGQNELIVGNMFHYEVYTYMNNSLHKVEQQGNVNENWHPLYNMKLCYNAESEKYVGITRIGITMWVGMFETSYGNDKLKFTEIVSMNEGDAAYGVQSTWYNGAGDEITESEYVELYNNYFKNLTEVAYTTDSIMLTDYDRLTRNEKFNRLKKSYEAFKIGEKIGGFEQISVSTPEKIIYSKENLNTYDDILSMYHHYISTQWEDYPDIYKGTQGMYGLTLNETSYLWYHYDKTNGLSNAGYQFMDINGDGTDELIVGRIDSNTGNGLLYDLYTIHNNEIIHLAASGERDWFNVGSNYEISESGSGGAALHIDTFYYIKDGELMAYEQYEYDGYSDPDNPYFYADECTLISDEYGGYYDFTNRRHITETEYNDKGEYTDKSLHFKPFSEYRAAR